MTSIITFARRYRPTRHDLMAANGVAIIACIFYLWMEALHQRPALQPTDLGALFLIGGLAFGVGALYFGLSERSRARTELRDSRAAFFGAAPASRPRETAADECPTRHLARFEAATWGIEHRAPTRLDPGGYGRRVGADGSVGYYWMRTPLEEVPMHSWEAMLRWCMENPWRMVEVGGWVTDAEGHSRFVGGTLTTYPDWLCVADRSTCARRSTLQW